MVVDFCDFTTLLIYVRTISIPFSKSERERKMHEEPVMNK
jgi:hypothetical protein